MGQFTIIISSGTADATKVHVALVNGFALVKGNPENKVEFILMAEGGWVVDERMLATAEAKAQAAESRALEAQRFIHSFINS